MTINVKMPGDLYDQVIQDLTRPHPFAQERVGFLFGRMGSASDGTSLIVLNRYSAVPDHQYVDDPMVGARIGEAALTGAMQAVYHGRATREGIFHVHLHHHKGRTRMSATDGAEIPKLIPGFQSVGRDAAHGIVVLSLDHGSCWVWWPESTVPILATSMSIIGAPVQVFEQVHARSASAAPVQVGIRERMRKFARVIWAYCTGKF